MDLSLENAHLGISVTAEGGSVWRFFAKRDGHAIPLFREPPRGSERVASRAGCFPLVPFGNRVRDNCFAFEGKRYALTPNMPSDRQFLHGDGWVGEWRVLRHDADRLSLGFERRESGTPYAYAAEQSFALGRNTLALSLTITNLGADAMPFGLGLHPYFPLTPDTILQTRTRSYWDEDESWLPTTEHATAGDLDFGSGARPPRRWVNTQFEGWDGQATIAWPERQIALRIDSDPLFNRCVLFVPDPAFDESYTYDYFCFEPMSHSIDAHNRADQGGLQRLEPGQSLSGSVRFTAESCFTATKTTAETTAAFIFQEEEDR